MTVSILLLVAMVVCFAAGISLLLERSLTRMVLGFLLVGNATNLLVFFMSGSFGAAPLFDPDLEPGDYSDPLPQAFILTAIVITFGVTAFMLALIYRSWRLAQADTIEDDEEDIAMRTVDLSKDDEPFDEEDAGDTEFGTSAEAAVSTASLAEDLDEIDATLEEYTDEHHADRLAVDELQEDGESDFDDDDSDSGSGSGDDGDGSGGGSSGSGGSESGSDRSDSRRHDDDGRRS